MNRGVGKEAETLVKHLWICVTAVFCLLAVYLVAAHGIKAYSDPLHWIERGVAMSEGRLPNRAPLYPLLLALVMPLTGPVYVFLVNGPFLFLMTFLLFWITCQLFQEHGSSSRSFSPQALLAGLIALSLFIALHEGKYLELLNPYREAVAFSLLLGGVALLLSFFNSGSLWKSPAAALLIGLSIGVRETCALVLVPVSLLFLYTIIRERTRHWAVGSALFLAFLLVGLLPFLYYNHLLSGQPLVPAFAARKWQSLSSDASFLPRDIPVPGMSLRYFSRTGERMAQYFWGLYGIGGLMLIAVGLIHACRARMAPVLLLIFPSALINLLFYAFWHAKRSRFYVIIDLFLASLLALGAVFLIDAAARRLERRRKGAYLAICAVIAWCLVLFTSFTLFNRLPEGLKVWQVKTLRSSILPSLEEPFVFVGSTHYSEMLYWLLGGSETIDEIRLQKGEVRKLGMDEALLLKGRENFSALSERNLYVYEKDRWPFLRQWFVYRPVASLASEDFSLTRHRKRLTGGIYGVAFWEGKTVERDLHLPEGPGPWFLKVDARRIWDYPSRTFCRLVVDDRVVEERVPNGIHFVPLPRETGSAGPVRLRLESDAPLPDDPLLEIFSRDSGTEIAFGLQEGRGWYYPHLSGDINAADPLKADAFTLTGRGEIGLPQFCGDNRELMATFRVENFENRRERMDFEIQMTSDADAVRRPLETRGRSVGIVVGLGEGTGSLEMTPLSLTYIRPPSDRRSFAKFHRVRLDCISRRPLPSLDIDVGGGKDLSFIGRGFYFPSSTGEKGTARWTNGDALLRLPLVRPRKDLVLTVEIQENRPPGRQTAPTFIVSGSPIPPERVREEQAADGRGSYTFSVEAERLAGDGGDTLEILSRPWRPAERPGEGDTRALGVLVRRVTAEPR